jgi:hypothetical protein
MTDFMIGLRVATTSGPETGVQRLEALRDLVFDAIIQGPSTPLPASTSVRAFRADRGGRRDAPSRREAPRGAASMRLVRR